MAALHRALVSGAVRHLESDRAVAARRVALEPDLATGRILPDDAAEELLRLHFAKADSPGDDRMA